MSAIRNALIREILNLDSAADRRTLEQMSQRELEARFSMAHAKKAMRFDSADPSTVTDGTGFNRDAAIEAIHRANPTSPLCSRPFLEGKSDTYLAARVVALRGDTSTVTDGTDSSSPPSRKDIPMTQNLDGYGRPIIGSQPVDPAARRDEADAYQRSVDRLNSGRRDADLTTGTGTITAAEKAKMGEAKGNEFENEPEDDDDPLAVLDETRRAARLANAQANAEASLERANARLNASRPVKYKPGQIVDPANVR